jgi:hypothetical protein
LALHAINRLAHSYKPFSTDCDTHDSEVTLAYIYLPSSQIRQCSPWPSTQVRATKVASSRVATRASNNNTPRKDTDRLSLTREDLFKAFWCWKS